MQHYGTEILRRHVQRATAEPRLHQGYELWCRMDVADGRKLPGRVPRILVHPSLACCVLRPGAPPVPHFPAFTNKVLAFCKTCESSAGCCNKQISGRRPVDLYSTNPNFGTMQDLITLLSVAKDQGDDPAVACFSTA